MNTFTYECRCFPKEFQEMYTKLMLQNDSMFYVAEKTYISTVKSLEDKCMRPHHIDKSIEQVAESASDMYIKNMCDPDYSSDKCAMALINREFTTLAIRKTLNQIPLKSDMKRCPMGPIG